MRRTFITLIIGMACAAVLLPPTAAQATGVHIAKIYWDSPGTDTGSNASLNAEYIVIKNSSSTPKKIAGWHVYDADGHRYGFPSGFRLAAGAVVRVHSGKGQNGAHDLYWNYGNYVWTNTGDTAKLKNSAGDLVARCSYKSTSPNPVRC